MEFNSTMSMAGDASIELDYQRLNETAISSWQLSEQELEERRNACINVEVWLQGVPSSRPSPESPDTIVNYQPLYMRQRVANEVVGRIDDVFSRISRAATRGRPSSVQTTGASAVTVVSKRSAAASIIVPSFEERSLDRRVAVPPSEPSSTPFGRKSRYHDTGNHDKGRPPETSVLLGGFQAASAAPLGPRTRGVKEDQTARPERQQVHWSRTNTPETNSAPTANRQKPKRRNSRLTDDELAGRRRRQKRPKTVLKDPSRSQTPRASPSSVNLPQPTTRRSPANPPGETPGRHRGYTPNRASPAPGLGGPTLDTQSGGVAQNPKSRLLTEEDFTAACGTCFFWLHKPKLYSSRDACHRRKKEISHIITHAIDHHGLIRVADPKNESRKFLLSCQNHNPTVKANGSCAKCQSADQWTEADLADPEHTGIALCTRCWCSFDMRGMKEHMAEKLCPYNTEQPKPNKMCILYTTFCSKTHPPSQPPEDNESDQKSPKSPSREGQRRRQGAKQQAQQHASQAMPRAHPMLPNLQPKKTPTKRASPQIPAYPPPSHSPLHAQGTLQRPPQPFTGSLSPQPWQPSIAEQPNQQNIVAYQVIPIYGSGPAVEPGATPVLFPDMSTAMYQDIRRGVSQAPSQPTNQLAPAGQPSVTHQQPFTQRFPQKQQQRKRPPQKQPARSLHTTKQPQGIQQQLPPQPQQQHFNEKRPQTAIQDTSFHHQVSPLQTAQKSQRQPKLEHAQQHPVMSTSLEPIPQPRAFLDLANRELQACWKAVNSGANMHQLGTTPTIDYFPDGISPLETSLPQSAPSQNPPTNGDPGDAVPMSPNIGTILDSDFSNVDWLMWDFMGSHLDDVPDFSYPTEQPPPRDQERQLEAPLPAGKQGAAETDSGFFSKPDSGPDSKPNSKPDSKPDWMDFIDFDAAGA